jgi:hypothetical protein
MFENASQLGEKWRNRNWKSAQVGSNLGSENVIGALSQAEISFLDDLNQFRG